MRIMWIKYIFRMLRVFRVICFVLSVFFGLKAVYPRSDLFRDCMIGLTVAMLGAVTIIILYLFINHCESDNADKRTKILYGVVRRVLQYIGIVICSILSAVLGHAVSYSHLAGCTDWLGGKLSIRGDDERVKAQLVVAIGMVLLVRNISLPILCFLDEWSWSDDDFWTVIGRVNGHIDRCSVVDEGASGGGGRDSGRGDMAGNSDMVIDIEAGLGRQESADGRTVEEFFDANDHF
ncbi:hypothetical protein OROGR_004577 [Orobanche gracilis]